MQKDSQADNTYIGKYMIWRYCNDACAWTPNLILWTAGPGTEAQVPGLRLTTGNRNSISEQERTPFSESFVWEREYMNIRAMVCIYILYIYCKVKENRLYIVYTYFLPISIIIELPA